MPRCNRRSSKDKKVRIGPDFQADIPDLLVPPESYTSKPLFEDTKFWAPNENVSDIKLNEFLLFANNKYGYNKEQAMGFLYYHQYDIETAIIDLQNYGPSPNSWTEKDMASFHEAINKYNKDFLRIKQVMPHKSRALLVEYYYMWKYKKEFCQPVLEESSRSEPDNKESGIPEIISN